MTRVAILDDYQMASRQFGAWESLGCEVVRFADHVGEADDVVARLRHFDVVVAMRERTWFTRAVLSRLPELRLLVTTGYRNAAIDIAAASEHGILVCGTGGYLHSTIELTWGLILGLLRNIPEEHASIRAGGWQHTMGGDLHGATLGVVGLGNMGKRVAQIGQAFGMNVIAWSQNMTQAACDAAGVTHVSKAEMFRTADILTVHLQLLGDRNRGVIGRDDLALMKPTAMLVNTSRGPIIDEGALIDCLREGRIAGAAIDVYDHEPLPRDHPFRNLPRLLTTPHIGYVTANTYKVFLEEAVEDIAAWMAGSAIRVIAHD